MPTGNVTQPAPLPLRGMPEERRLLAEVMHLLARVFIRLDEHREKMINGETQDDFHTLAVDMTDKLDELALALAGNPRPNGRPLPPQPQFDNTLKEHGLTGEIGEVKRNTLRRCAEEFLAAFGGGPETGPMVKRAIVAAAATFEAGAFVLDSIGLKPISEGCATAKSICDAVVRRFDSWSGTVYGWLRHS